MWCTFGQRKSILYEPLQKERVFPNQQLVAFLMVKKMGQNAIENKEDRKNYHLEIDHIS